MVDGNEVMGMKCCNNNSNKGIDLRIGNEDFFVWCVWLKNGNERYYSIDCIWLLVIKNSHDSYFHYCIFVSKSIIDLNYSI